MSNFATWAIGAIVIVIAIVYRIVSVGKHSDELDGVSDDAV